MNVYLDENFAPVEGEITAFEPQSFHPSGHTVLV